MGLLDALFGRKPETPEATTSNTVPFVFETHPATVTLVPEGENFSGMTPERFNQRLARLREALPRAKGQKHGEVAAVIAAMEAYRARFLNG